MDQFTNISREKSLDEISDLSLGHIDLNPVEYEEEKEERKKVLQRRENIGDFRNMPRDILYNIMLNMDIKSVISMCRTNKDLKSIICDNPIFWKRKIENVFGGYPDIDYTLLRNWYFGNSKHIYKISGTDAVHYIDEINDMKSSYCKNRLLAYITYEGNLVFERDYQKFKIDEDVKSIYMMCTLLYIKNNGGLYMYSKGKTYFIDQEVKQATETSLGILYIKNDDSVWIDGEEIDKNVSYILEAPTSYGVSYPPAIYVKNFVLYHVMGLEPIEIEEHKLNVNIKKAWCYSDMDKCYIILTDDNKLHILDRKTNKTKMIGVNVSNVFQYDSSDYKHILWLDYENVLHYTKSNDMVIIFDKILYKNIKSFYYEQDGYLYVVDINGILYKSTNYGVSSSEKFSFVKILYIDKTIANINGSYVLTYDY